jgi:hypothetical protein
VQRESGARGDVRVVGIVGQVGAKAIAYGVEGVGVDPEVGSRGSLLTLPKHLGPGAGIDQGGDDEDRAAAFRGDAEGVIPEELLTGFEAHRIPPCRRTHLGIRLGEGGKARFRHR